MSRPVSLAVKPPGAKRATWNAPSQAMFADDSDEEGDAFASASGSKARPASGSVKVEDERIDGFGANGRALGRRSPEPLVIAPLPNRDWRAVARQSSNRAPAYRPERRDDGPVVTHERTGDAPQRSGLRRAGDIDPDYDDRKPGAAELAAAAGAGVKAEAKEEVKEEEGERKPLTLDEEALAAVLAGDAPVSDAQRSAANLVIESAANRNIMTDDAALERDLNLLPDESTLDDYDAVPVEAFGEAMLRGMGYNPSNETPMHVPKPRPALLGIGATALSSELPPTRKDAKKRREERATRGGRGYNAAGLLVQSNRPSREASAVGDSREASASASRGASPGEKRRREDDDGRDSKRRYDDRERDRDRDRRRGDRDDRDRRRTDDRDRDRDRDRDGRRYETEEERARRKERERERDRDRDGRRDRDRDYDRDRDRERSRRDDRERERDRDRRERDRDRDRR